MPPAGSRALLDAGAELELDVLLAGVLEVLELDHAHLLEAVAQPLVVAVEEAELLAVRHDLREEHLLEEIAGGVAHDDRQDVLRVDAHALPDLLRHEAVAHA